MAKTPWKPWHEVVELRDDLKQGELALHMFAADLYEVLMQSGIQPTYEDRESFFALTFPTRNLRYLVREVALRVAGKNDKAVRQLELTYGGGKTHALITLCHLMQDPESLPDLPSVHEFQQEIGEAPPQARVVGLCFDKLDLEKPRPFPGPNGQERALKHPWSVLAYQLAGDAGLELLHAEGKAEERDSAPAEGLLVDLLRMPSEDGLGTLVLIDEVLMYAREEIGESGVKQSRLLNFLQALTQAATKVDRCCVVASLLSSEPLNLDAKGRQIQAQLENIFQRQREETIEPVVKEDVAEVLRRRFFKPESIRDRERFRQHVIAALKGVSSVDEQTAKQGQSAEDRFLTSYPFHPDLTEVLYEKWTQLDRFQRTRGVLRTFALALREAAKWDEAPLVGPSVFLSEPGREDLSESARELVNVADTEEHEGKRQAWTSVLVGELSRARQIQTDSVGLDCREVEQAVLATFLHSQPIGHEAQTRELMVLVGATRPDRIELEKALKTWSRVSHWLDDKNAQGEDEALPGAWRLGNRPNLTQMHAVAMSNVNDEVVKARLLDEIQKTKALTATASAAGVRVHTLPTHPREIQDDGDFHYAVLGPSAASESGKPSSEAARYLDQTTGADKPRVYRNAVILLTPSRDGLDLASRRVREYLAWDNVREELEAQKEEGHVDPARLSTLAINLDKARQAIPTAIREAYCIAVTVSDANNVQAFKIAVSADLHFAVIKGDKRSRIQETAITAEALLPEGPYDLWQEGESSRRVKDLTGAFAQLPHLPKMLKSAAILDTLVAGCEEGAFVLRLKRPDNTYRTWWRSRPDDVALNDAAIELVLPDADDLSLSDVPSALLAPEALPSLWSGDKITVQSVLDYFSGGNVVTVTREVEGQTYDEPMVIPKAVDEVVNASVEGAVEDGSLWLLSGPASVWGEPVPAGVSSPGARLRKPPETISAMEILPEALSDAWKDGKASALSVSTALSQAKGETLPWKSVSDVIDAALKARFLVLGKDSAAWPCDSPAAQQIKLQVPEDGVIGGGDVAGGGDVYRGKLASAELEPNEIQDLAEVVPQLAEIRAKSDVPMTFRLQVELGNAGKQPSSELLQELNALLGEVKEGFGFA